MSAGKIVLTPSGKRGLLSSGKAALFDASGECAECCEGEPCIDCDPDGSGTTPESANIAGLTADCTLAGDVVNPAPYNNFDNIVDGGDQVACELKWTTTTDGEPAVENEINFIVGFALTNHTVSYGGVSLSVSADEVYVILDSNDSPDPNRGIWLEKTTGFSCDSSTGKVSGTHTFGLPGATEDDCVDDTPTVTVDP